MKTGKLILDGLDGLSKVGPVEFGPEDYINVHEEKVG